MLRLLSFHGSRLHPLPPRVHPVIGYGLLALGLLLAFVWEGSTVDHLNIQLEQAKAGKRQIETRLAELSVMADDLSSLVQVEERATRELGLRRPDTDGIVEVLFPDVQPGSRFDLGRIVPDANAQTRGTRRP
jgi:hypothetical protein